jgi:O-antigen/teichoic acid export membrane protein
MIQLSKRSAPLAFSAGIYTLNPNIVSYFAFPCLGESLFKIFGILQFMTVPGQMIMNSIGLALTPRLARIYADGQYRDFRRQLIRMVALMAAMGLVGVIISAVAGRWILSKLFPPEYADHATTLVWLFIAASISYVAGLLGYATTSTRTFHRFAIPYIAITLVALAASALFVPLWGMLGGAIAYGAIYLAAAAAFITIMALAGVFRPTRPPAIIAAPQTTGSNL